MDRLALSFTGLTVCSGGGFYRATLAAAQDGAVAFQPEELEQLPNVRPRRPVPAAIQQKVDALRAEYARIVENGGAGSVSGRGVVQAGGVAADTLAILIAPGDPVAPPRMDSGDPDPDRTEGGSP